MQKMEGKIVMGDENEKKAETGMPSLTLEPGTANERKKNRKYRHS